MSYMSQYLKSTPYVNSLACLSFILFLAEAINVTWAPSTHWSSYFMTAVHETYLRFIRFLLDLFEFSLRNRLRVEFVNVLSLFTLKWSKICVFYSCITPKMLSQFEFGWQKWCFFLFQDEQTVTFDPGCWFILSPQPSSNTNLHVCFRSYIDVSQMDPHVSHPVHTDMDQIHWHEDSKPGTIV